MNIYQKKPYIFRQKLLFFARLSIILSFIVLICISTTTNAKAIDEKSAGLGLWENIPSFSNSNLILEENLYDQTRSDENLYTDSCYVFGKLNDLELYISNCKKIGYSNVKMDMAKNIDDLSYRIIYLSDAAQKELLFVLEVDENEMGLNGMQVYIGKEQLPDSVINIAFWWNNSTNQTISALGCGKYAYTPCFPTGTKFLLKKHWIYDEYPDICENCVRMDQEKTLDYIKVCKQFGYDHVIESQIYDDYIYYIATNKDHNYIKIEWKKENGVTWVASRKNEFPQ